MAAEVRVLGELQAVRDGRPQALPTSRKTRALLGYLAITRRAHARSKLCDLLWDDADDPRGALRWSLSRLRRALGADALHADRSHVAWAGGPTDLDRLVALAPRSGPAPAATVDEVLGLVRGELLEGDDLPSHLTWQSWLTAEREAAYGLHQRVLAQLWHQLDDPEVALAVARQWVQRSPLSEEPHAAVARSLAALGRIGEAFDQLERCRDLFREELGVAPSGAAVVARRELAASRSATPVASVPAAVAPAAAAPPPFVGRDRELADLHEVPEALCLVLGEPGIGKSALLGRAAAQAAQHGERVLRGAGFEAEQVRPWGPWVDALAARGDDVPASLVRDLGPLVGGDAAATDQNRLFRATLALLRHLAPVLVVLDDLHWADESSLALLHYVGRAERPGVRLWAAARPTELEEHPEARPMLDSLRRAGRLRRIALGPLDEAPALTLAEALVSREQVGDLVERAGGSPLVLIELARGGDALLHTLGERIARLPDGARQLAGWAAALGSGITVDRLEEALEVDLETLLERLEALERHGVLRDRDGAYAFSHDLLRQAAYRQLSGPRRQRVHRQLAQALVRSGAPAHEVAVQASLGGDHRLAVTAFAQAASASLAQIAPAEAIGLARRGLQHAERLGDATPREWLDLWHPLLRAGSMLKRRPPPGMEARITEALAQVERIGDDRTAVELNWVLSVIHDDGGARQRAARTTLAAAAVARRTDPLVAARQLSNTARCLLSLETQVGEARALIGEARQLVEDLDIVEVELEWGRGLLARWDGDPATAAALLERSAALAARAGDAWSEAQLLTSLAVVSLEAGDDAACQRWAAALAAHAERLGEGPTGPLARALGGLAAGRADVVEEALSVLSTLDSPGQVALVHNLAAARSLAEGAPARAEAHARAALAATSAVRDGVLARMHLARVALGVGAVDRAREWLAPVVGHLDEEDTLDRPTAQGLAELWHAAR